MNLKTKLAATLLRLRNQHGCLMIPLSDAERLTAEQIIARFEFHHEWPKADGGSDRPDNIQPMLKEEHRLHTAKVDIPRIAKNKRIKRKQEAHELRMRGKNDRL